MASRYLKLDPELIHQIKKDIKSSEETFYTISQKINAYKLLRKKEIILKNKLKIALSSLKSKIDYMESTFPDEERKNMEYALMQKESHQKKLRPRPINQHIKQEQKKDISEDLEEIRKKLAKLGM